MSHLRAPVRFLLVGALGALGALGSASAQGHDEHPSDAPLPAPFRLESPNALAAQSVVQRGPFTSVQVNVNGAGNNIPGDAANEPSITIDPNDPSRLTIGWRQFDNVASNFRESGVAYSTDGGATWTYPGAIQNGLFNSDPVLASDNNGHTFYLAYPSNTTLTLFRSTNGGQTWPTATTLVGGDKAWMTVDNTGGVGDGNIYVIWQVVHGPNTFTRSTNIGVSFATPTPVPGIPTFGTISVDANGNVFAAGLNQQFFSSFILAKSTNAKFAAQTPTFNTVNVNMGGSMSISAGPNPGGLLGQAQAIADPTNPNRVYMLASVNPPGSDPLDVHIVRSNDGGNTFGSPIRINDDGTGNWQWFGTLGVAPNGRLDVIWNDTRLASSTSTSETYYSYSMDTGLTWAKNTPVSPSWDSTIGFPNQNKIGDYYDIRSDNAAANLAYAATFNGEQDVYFLRVGDCNGNQVHDGVDLATGDSFDSNTNAVLDECETCQRDLGFGEGTISLSICGDPLNVAGSSTATLDVAGAASGTSIVVFLAAARLAQPVALPGGGSFVPDPAATIAVPFALNGNGRLGLPLTGGPNNNVTLYSQAVALTGPLGFLISNAVEIDAGTP